MPDEKTHADALRLYLTGAASDGGAQTDPLLSKGHFRSTTEVTHLESSVTNPISNVTINFIAGANGVGDGTLAAKSTTTLAWTAPGGSEGTAVTIANGETKILEDGTDPTKYVRVTRTSATNLSGTATVALTEKFNNAIGMANIPSADAVTGRDDYSCIVAKCESPLGVGAVKACLKTLGTQATSSEAQLGASGSGTIQGPASCFADWPTSGWALVREADGTPREVVYYSSRTDDTLTVPEAGRERLGTTAAAGASDDTVDAIPGIALAKEEPESDNSLIDNTDDSQESVLAALDWNVALDPDLGLGIGTLVQDEIYGIWIWRETVPNQVARSDFSNLLSVTFDAA